MKPSYIQLGTIDTPTDYVLALAFSTNGRYLASTTNDNTLRVYDIQHSFATIWEEKGDHPFTAVAWRDNTLFVGSMDGTVFYCHPLTRWALEFNQRGDYLLVCSGADVFLFEKRSWNYRDYLPRPEPFGEPNNGDNYPIIATGAHFLDHRDQCIIGYLYNGFWKFDLEMWESTNCWGPDNLLESNDPRRHYSRMFDELISVASAMSPDSKSIVTTDACLGLQWFKVMPERLKSMSVTYHPQDPQSNVPLPVLFINQGQAAIMGLTKGCALILESKRADKIQTLKHGNDRTWVTALAYVESAGGKGRMIVTGDGNRGQHTKIIIWTEDKRTRGSLPKIHELWYIVQKMSIYIWIAMQTALILMGFISTLLWISPTSWKEVIRPLGNLSAYTFSIKRAIPIPSFSTPSPVPTTTSDSPPLMTKVVGLLDAFGDFLCNRTREFAVGIRMYKYGCDA
ncbi:WD40-repeat-containing domain protein [Lentinula raphanica]|nr:WD40-repeat-containing domain protein [Lentinula raphanica]